MQTEMICCLQNVSKKKPFKKGHRGNSVKCLLLLPMPTILLPNPDEAVEAAPIGELWLEDSVQRPRSIEPPVSDRDFLKRCLLSHRSWLDGLEIQH